jgi:hypothetical protein
MGGAWNRRDFLRYSFASGLSATNITLLSKLLGGCASSDALDQPTELDQSFERAWQSLVGHFEQQVRPNLLKSDRRKSTEISALSGMYRHTLTSSQNFCQALLQLQKLADKPAEAELKEVLRAVESQIQAGQNEAELAFDAFTVISRRLPAALLTPEHGRKIARQLEQSLAEVTGRDSIKALVTPEMGLVFDRLSQEISGILEQRGLAGLMTYAEELFRYSTGVTPPPEGQDSPLLLERFLEGMWHDIIKILDITCGWIQLPAVNYYCVQILYSILYALAINLYIGFLPSVFLTGILGFNGLTEEEIHLLNILFLVNAVVYGIILIKGLLVAAKVAKNGAGAFDGMGDPFGNNV